MARLLNRSPNRFDPTERWFIQRGVPHFIEDYSAFPDIWTRAIPLLVAAYVGGGLNALRLGSWSTVRNVVAAAAVLAILLATWVLTNVIRGRPLMSWPRTIGTLELAAFLIGPAVPSLLFRQYRDAAESMVGGAAVLVLIYVVTSYGMLPLLAWGGRRALGQLSVLWNLVGRALPLLLLFITFLFINAEVWQVAGTLHGGPYWFVLGTFFVLGVAFVLTRVGPLTRELSHFDSWADVAVLTEETPLSGIALPVGVPNEPPLSRRQRFNVMLVSVFSQALQVTSVALIVGLFFVMFGFVAINADTTASWIGHEPHVLLEISRSGDNLVITDPLLRVSGFLAAFTGLYFTVVLSTDATYREEFAEDVAPQIRQVFAVRLAYLRTRAAATG
jgi:hypothetical protein